LRFLIHIICGCFVYFTSSGQDNPYIQLRWADEFDYQGPPNPAFWTYDLGTGQNGWGNREVQNYTNDLKNVRVENGKLIIEARKENNNWTSGRIKTQGKINFQYGKVEFRAKIPAGSGTWPALWMLGENITQVGWPNCGEIDVMEHVGRQPGIIHGSIHNQASYGATQYTQSINIPDYSTSFHNYAVTWSPEKIVFSINDDIFYTYAPTTKTVNNWPFDQPFFLIINIAMGGNFGSDPQYETGGLKNGIDPALTSAIMEVEYVRVYGPFDRLDITGPAYLDKNAQNVKFEASLVIGASYEWNFPDGVEIIKNEGNVVYVNWGGSGGKVSVTMTHENEVFLAEMGTELRINPSLRYDVDINASKWAVPAEFSELFAIEELENGTKINFNVQNPSANPYLILNLPAPVNMQEFNKLAFAISSENAPTTLRVDLLDINGTSSGNLDPFKFEPMNQDGVSHQYVHYYENVFPNVSMDNKSIFSFRMYVNYGAFATPGSGNFVVHSAYTDLPTDAGPPLKPTGLMAAEKNLGVELVWQDNSTNEKGYRIFRKEEGAPNFQILVHWLPVDTEMFHDATAMHGKKYYYNVVAFNPFGVGEPSDDVYITLSPVTSVEADFPAFQRFFPNPFSSSLTLYYPEYPVFHVKVFDIGGRIIHVQDFIRNHTLKINTEQWQKGVYIIQVTSGIAIKKFKVVKID
jgi:beta-glucanase (GH16 family)